MAGSSKAVVWRERLRRFERAGLTVAEFCRREAVSVPSFYQWRRRLAGMPVLADPSSQRPRGSRALARSNAPPSRRRGEPAFQRVMLSAGGVVAVALPSGVRIELPAEQTPLVRAVLADLLLADSGRIAGGV